MSIKKMAVAGLLAAALFEGIASVGAEAAETEKVLHVNRVYYRDNAYSLLAVDGDGEGWIINLLKAEAKDKSVLSGLRKALKGRRISATFDDMETKDIKDDEITSWELLR